MTAAAEADYPNEQEAARALLTDVCKTLLDTKVQFAVVGGWVPFLLSSTSDLRHPGTFDADVLVAEPSLSDGTFRTCINVLLERGYMRPAKNQFQAFRVLAVRGERRVFHADFLNPGSPSPEDLSFVRLDEEDRLGSAYTPVMDAVFKYDNWRYVDDGALANVRFASELGFIITKAHATTSKKRLRDLFDIYMTLRASKSPGRIVETWKAELERGVDWVEQAHEYLGSAVKSEATMKHAEELFQGTSLTREDLRATVGTLL
jgi:hypothetical protein